MLLLRFKYFLFLIFILLFPVGLQAQYYNLGQDPASLKWRIIKTPDFRLIFPEDFEPQAQRMIQTLEYLHDFGGLTLNNQPQRIPFIIHNRNIEPNGFTAWAPKRVELYTCPPQDSYSQPWLDQLSIHEYRHVAQLDRTNQGFTKLLSLLAGQQAVAAITGLFIPPWFLEGDAVCTETALSSSGRGRVPAFEMELRAQVLQKETYSYDKAALGSYHSFVPNNYVLGYHLVADVRRKYGYQAWTKALDEVAQRPFTFTPFNHGLRKATGFTKEKLYTMTMHELDSLWKKQAGLSKKSGYNELSERSDRYENYTYPHYLNDTLVVARHTGLDDIPRFVLVGPNGFQHPLFAPGLLSSGSYSVNARENQEIDQPIENQLFKGNVVIAWCEQTNDPRWENRTYSEIRLFDLTTGSIRTLTRKSRYFSPAISPDGQTLLAVKVDETNVCSLVLLGLDDGREKETFISSADDFFMAPCWSEDGKQIVFTSLNEQGKSIIIFRLAEKLSETILPPTFSEVSDPVFADRYVLFNGSYSGIGNIYAIDTSTKVVYQVTSSEFGAYQANVSADGSKIVYADYNSQGFGLVESALDPSTWKPLQEVKDYSPSLYKHLLTEEPGRLDKAIPGKMNYASVPYRKAAHIFNFYSWAPVYLNYMNGENGAGVSFMSQNELNTATTVVGYQYDLAEQSGKTTLDFNWEGWYPKINIKSSHGGRNAVYVPDSGTKTPYSYNETMVGGGFSLPLLFTGGTYYKGMLLSATTTLYSITKNTSPDTDKLEGTIHTLDYSFTAYRYIRQAYRDLFPRWGQVLVARFRHSPFGDHNLGSIASIETRFYFPGFRQHQGFRLDLRWQERNEGKYLYANQSVLPRGYLFAGYNSLKSLSVNYKFPFAYPDAALGGFMFLKRLKANLFYDLGQGENKGADYNLQSFGSEITADVHFFRFIFPFDMGIRVGYKPDEKTYFSDFLFSVNLSD